MHTDTQTDAQTGMQQKEEADARDARAPEAGEKEERKREH